MTVRPKTRKKLSPKKINCGLLHTNEYKDTYMNTLRTSLAEVDSDMYEEDLDVSWGRISDAICSDGLAALGTSRKKHRDWFDESDEVVELIRAKNAANASAIANPNSVHLRQKFADLRAETQRRLRVIENNWWENFATEIQTYADTNDIHKFYEAIRTAVGPTRRPLMPV